ncbi:hypothetical protein ACJDT4_11930 [Clostridium neuense]|uniref:Uncharacterized protein n=1 Tax=Clostridium neuense TaxID=1728934 RepID=A0ABW8TI32_9CLOT
MNEIQKNNAGTLGLISLVLVIIGFIIPILGAAYIVPIALLICTISLHERIGGTSVATLAIAIIKLAISPTFWVHLIGIGGLKSLFFSWGSVVCIVLSIYYSARHLVGKY